MGWVYYANYFSYFEVGRTELIRNIWRPYRDIEKDGLRLPVVQTGCRYISGARYDDRLEITSHLSLPSMYRLRFDYEITHADEGQTIARGFTEHCFVSADGKLMPIPEDLRNKVGQ